MKRDNYLFILFFVIAWGVMCLITSCTKQNTDSTTCMQCAQVCTDSVTGKVISVDYGSNNSTIYCGNCLNIVKNQKPSIFHNMIIFGSNDTSYCQIYTKDCK